MQRRINTVRDMLYNSYIFLLFLPLVLIAFYLAMSKLGRNYALATLALASFIFYGWWELAYVPLLFLSALGNFLIGRRIQASRSASAQQQKLILIIGLSGNLGLLAYYKYAGFFAGFLQALGSGGLDFSEVVLPLAISFFTFQQIAYLMDLSRGDEVRYSFLEYLVFVTFFPQLIAGPIVHHREMMPQLQGLRPSDQTLTNLSVGFSLFILGLGKKVLLADNFSGLADASFALADSGIAQGSTGAWMGSLAYSLQIYFDFSGYSDMALGLGILFGVRLPANFNSPYKASNIIDFWRRWHITLSRFLRDYLYIPLGGNRRGRPRRYLNLVVTMTLGGLWHGAGTTFVLWGALHGLYLCVNHLWRRLTRAGKDVKQSPGLFATTAYRAITLLAILIAWVLFRAENIDTFTTMLTDMVSSSSTSQLKLLYCCRRTEFDFLLNTSAFMQLPAGELWQIKFYQDLALLSLGALICLFLPNAMELFQRHQVAIDADNYVTSRTGTSLEWHASPLWATSFGILLFLSVMQLSQLAPFLYFQF